jgi:hypothetical protein
LIFGNRPGRLIPDREIETPTPRPPPRAAPGRAGRTEAMSETATQTEVTRARLPRPPLGPLVGYQTTDQAAVTLRVSPVLLRWAIHCTRVPRYQSGLNQKLLDAAGIALLDRWLRQHDPGGLFRTSPGRRGARRVRGEETPGGPAAPTT